MRGPGLQSGLDCAGDGRTRMDQVRFKAIGLSVGASQGARCQPVRMAGCPASGGQEGQQASKQASKVFNTEEKGRYRGHGVERILALRAAFDRVPREAPYCSSLWPPYLPFSSVLKTLLACLLACRRPNMPGPFSACLVRAVQRCASVPGPDPKPGAVSLPHACPA